MKIIILSLLIVVSINCYSQSGYHSCELGHLDAVYVDTVKIIYFASDTCSNKNTPRSISYWNYGYRIGFFDYDYLGNTFYYQKHFIFLDAKKKTLKKNLLIWNYKITN